MDPLLTTKPNPRHTNKTLFITSVAVIAIVTAFVCLLNTPSSLMTSSSLYEVKELDAQAFRNLFEQWKLAHAKIYDTVEEEAYRFKVFLEAYEYITAHNSKGDTAVLGLTKFADLTNEEFKAQYMSGLVESAKKQDDQPEDFSIESPVGGFPSEWDWRTKGAVTPVMNEGQCGSTYIFAPVWALEGYYFIKTGSLIQFSYQQVLDCDTVDYGCNGGYPTNVLTYTGKNGIERYSDYPYTGGKQGACQYNKSLAIKANVGYAAVPPKNATLLQAAVYGTPVSINMEADQKVFQYYTSGVITSDCGTRVDHCVTAVGWTNYNGTDAWIMKNMWGSDWGMNGYVLIGMDGTANGGQGLCGILSGPIVPV